MKQTLNADFAAIEEFVNEIDLKLIQNGYKTDDNYIHVYEHHYDTVVVAGKSAVLLTDKPFPSITSDFHFEKMVKYLSSSLKEKCKDLYYKEMKDPKNYMGGKYIAEVWHIPNRLISQKVITLNEEKQVVYGYEVIKEKHAALK